MNASTATIPDARCLVNELSAQLADAVILPAIEALSAPLMAQVRTHVGRLVNAGRIDDARQLVALNIEVVSVAAEASRHMHQSDCRLCPDFWRHCDTLQRLEAREDSLHHQIAALGGF